LWRAVIARGDEALLLDPAAAAEAARRAYQAMHEHGIPAARIAADDGDEARLLTRWIRRFEADCAAHNRVSASALLQGFDAAPEPIAWIDSPGWRPAVRRWLQRHAADPIRPEAAGTARAWRHLAATPEAEAAAAAHWMREQRQADGEFRAWIHVPDLNQRRLEWVDAFDAELAPRRFGLAEAPLIAPYAVAGGVSLREHPPVRSVLEFLELSTGMVSFERFSVWLRSPEWHATSEEAGAAALLDVELRRRAPAEAPLPRWLELAQRLGEEPSRRAAARPVPALARLADACAILERQRAAAPCSVWVTLWAAAFERGPWSQRHRWSSGEFQAAERLRELMGSLAAAEATLGSRRPAEAARLLARAVGDTLFQGQTGVAPIWISGQALDPWLGYDAVWIAGFDARRWPPPVDPLPLLPVRLQREYGVIAASAEAQRGFALDLQQRWSGRAPCAVYSYAADGDSPVAAPSPLLPVAAALSADPAPTRPLWRRSLAAAPVFERLSDEQGPPFGAPERTHGIATLKAQSQCAFRGFATTRLEAADLELPVPGFNALERGILVHTALESIWRELRTHAALINAGAAALEGLIEAGVAAALRQVTPRRDPGPQWQRRERVRLAPLLREWLDLERPRLPFVVEHIEAGDEHARFAGVEFTCRIDRIDRLDDGARILIDYKSGQASRDWRGERPDNPQLPVYALLHRDALVAVAYGRVNAAECAFVGEWDRADLFRRGGRATPLEGQPDLAALLGEWQRRVERIAGEFAAGRAEVLPTATACRHCRLQGLCRVARVDPDD
jgi:probable DNA repair protein